MESGDLRGSAVNLVRLQWKIRFSYLAVRFVFPSSYVPDLGERALIQFGFLARGACVRWRQLVSDSGPACSCLRGVTGWVKFWVFVTEFCYS
jgi:hypothetical protein